MNFLTANPAASGMGSTVFMLVMMVAIMYFVMIRPENKRKKEAEEMRAAVKKGDKVVTIGGITGTVVDVKDNKFVLETGADQVRIDFYMNPKASFWINDLETRSDNRLKFCVDVNTFRKLIRN